MVTEVAIFTALPGKEDELGAAIVKGSSIIKQVPECLSARVLKVCEDSPMQAESKACVPERWQRPTMMAITERLDRATGGCRCRSKTRSLATATDPISVTVCHERRLARSTKSLPRRFS